MKKKNMFFYLIILTFLVFLSVYITRNTPEKALENKYDKNFKVISEYKTQDIIKGVAIYQNFEFDYFYNTKTGEVIDNYIGNKLQKPIEEQVALALDGRSQHIETIKMEMDFTCIKENVENMSIEEYIKSDQYTVKITITLKDDLNFKDKTYNIISALEKKNISYEIYIENETQNFTQKWDKITPTTKEKINNETKDWKTT